MMPLAHDADAGHVHGHAWRTDHHAAHGSTSHVERHAALHSQAEAARVYARTRGDVEHEERLARLLDRVVAVVADTWCGGSPRAAPDIRYALDWPAAVAEAHRTIGRLSAALARLLSIPLGTCETADLLRAAELARPVAILESEVRRLRAVETAAGDLLDAAEELSSAIAGRGEVRLTTRLYDACEDADEAARAMRDLLHPTCARCDLPDEDPDPAEYPPSPRRQACMLPGHPRDPACGEDCEEVDRG